MSLPASTPISFSYIFGIRRHRQHDLANALLKQADCAAFSSGEACRGSQSVCDDYRRLHPNHNDTR